ncbi:52 kDa repressor of the inhibitor of the protein kinase-like isoform X1 [Rhinoraja longicauda]
MPNFCAAPNCSRKSTNCPEIPFFRFPKDPERCQKWVENCRRADLENRSAEQLHKQYRLCARHFEQYLICTNSPYRTVLKDNAVPTLFDLTSHLNKPEGKHRKHKLIKELTEEDLLRVKAPRTDGDVLRGLQCKQEPANELEKSDLEGATGLEDSALLQEPVSQTPEERENKEFLKVLFETLLLLGRQNVPLGGSGSENVGNLCSSPDNIQALLEFRMNAGDEVLRKRFETTAVNAVYCPKSLQKDLLDICEMCIREEVLREIRDSNFFSIITDDVINIAGVDFVTLLIRFIDESDSLRQEFVGFLPCELEGELLASRIHETLTEKWGLNMYYCRGQAYNGSGTMSYKKQVVVASILQQCPKALCTPCSSYPLNIWMAKSSLIFGINMVLNLMDNIVSFFCVSPQLQKVFEVGIDTAYQTNEEKAKELKKLFQVNWYERHNTFEILVDIYEVLVTCLDEISYDTCGRWNAAIVTQASMLSSTMRDFEIIVSLMVLKNVLSYTRAFGKNLQAQALDTYFASSTLTAVLHSLNEVRDNIEVYHEFWLEEATNLSFKMGIELKLPWRCRRPPQNEEMSEENPENYYKEAITAPFLDHIILEIEDMFAEQQLRALKCLSLVPSVMAQLKYNTGEENMADMYKDDLPNPETLSAELHCWKIKWKHRSRDVKLPSTISDTLRHPDIKFFPNVYTLLKIISNLPIIKLDTDKCDVGRRRLKAYLKATPAEERTSSLALIHINYDAKHDYDMMVDTYAKLYPEKMQLAHMADADGVQVEVNNRDGTQVEISSLAADTGPLYEVDGDCMEVVSHTMVSGIVLHHPSSGTILEACDASRGVIEVAQHPEGSTVELQQLPAGSTMIVTQHPAEGGVELQHHPQEAGPEAEPEPEQEPVGSNVEVLHHVEGTVVEVNGMEIQQGSEVNGMEIQHSSEVNGMEIQQGSEVNGMEIQQGSEVNGLALEHQVVEVSHHSDMRVVAFEAPLEGGTVELPHHVQEVAVTLQHHMEGGTVELQHHPEGRAEEMHHPETSAAGLSQHAEESVMQVDQYPEPSTADLQQPLEPIAIELPHQPEAVTAEILCHPESGQGDVQSGLEPVAADQLHPPEPGEAELQPSDTPMHQCPEPVVLEIQPQSVSVTTEMHQDPEPPSTEIQHHPQPSGPVIQHPSEAVISETQLHLESATSEVQHSEPCAMVIPSDLEPATATMQHYSEPVAEESSACVVQDHPEPAAAEVQQHPACVTAQIHQHPGSTIVVIQHHPEATVTEIHNHPLPSALMIPEHPAPDAAEITDHSDAGDSNAQQYPVPNVLELQSPDVVIEGCPQVDTVQLEHGSDAGTVEEVEVEHCTETVEIQEPPVDSTVEVDSVSVCTQDVNDEGIKILEAKNSEENSEMNISSVSNVNSSEVAVQ